MSHVPPAPQRIIDRRHLGATTVLLTLLFGIALAPIGMPPSAAEIRAEYIAGYVESNAQEFVMTATLADRALEVTGPVVRDEYAATPGPGTYIAGGTNHDWAKLVLVYAGWPVTDNNVTVITRWMRQENGADDWYNRNNPLNIGAGGYASYPDLQTSAQVVARALTGSGMYRDIAAGFASSAEPSVTEYAIWASPWAGGHYAWGGHWHYTPVEVVSAPSGAWGR
jgi:hypothetical protein